MNFILTHYQDWLKDVARLGVWLLLLTVIFVPLERLFALHPQKIFRRAIAVDLGYYFINSLFVTALLTVPLALIAGTGYKLVPWRVHALIGELPFWLRAIAALMVAEIGFYWGHRWSHEIPFLWRFHAIHHSAEHLDFLVNTRAHVIDMVFGRLCGLIPMYVLGLASPIGAEGSLIPIIVGLFATVWGYFIHANIRWRLGKLEWLVATPRFHHWHHTLAEPLDRNFAPNFPWIDRLFGTLYLPKGEWPEAYGIKDKMPTSLHGQLVQPLLPPRPVVANPQAS